jgi:hydrogenase expression/formation protein HypE
MAEKRILLAHGAGGRLMRDLIGGVFFPRLGGEVLTRGEDAAVLEKVDGRQWAFATDAFVVTPLFFPGGDIGRLAVFGTVNDLAAMGAKPRFLSLAMVLEEGLDLGVLERVTDSVARAAEEAEVQVVCGDTKVVERGAADGMYLCTAGLGLIEGEPASPARVQAGDAVLISGTVGDHEMAVLLAREGLPFEAELESDCAPLAGLVAAVRGEVEVHAMRDPTRGGLGAVLNEIAEQAGLQIEIDERAVPVAPAVAQVCEVLGFDLLYLANEGKMGFFVPAAQAARAVEIMRAHPLGKSAAIVGRVVEGRAGRVVLNTVVGGRRILDLPLGEQLPRIC